VDSEKAVRQRAAFFRRFWGDELPFLVRHPGEGRDLAGALLQ
jgi:hypothetical protein